MFAEVTGCQERVRKIEYLIKCLKYVSDRPMNYMKFQV